MEKVKFSGLQEKRRNDKSRKICVPAEGLLFFDKTKILDWKSGQSYLLSGSISPSTTFSGTTANPVGTFAGTIQYPQGESDTQTFLGTIQDPQGTQAFLNTIQPQGPTTFFLTGIIQGPALRHTTFRHFAEKQKTFFSDEHARTAGNDSEWHHLCIE